MNPEEVFVVETYSSALRWRLATAELANLSEDETR